MEKRFAVMSMSCALALTLGLAGCGGGNSTNNETSSTSSAVSSSETSSTSSATSTSSTSSASTSSSSSSTTDAQVGTPKVEMKNVGLVHTYEADGSVVTDVAVQVQNTGDVPLVMSNPSVRIGDADGTVIVDKSDDSIFTGPTYLRVGDVGFIYTNSPIHLPEGYAVSQDYLAQATADLTACKEVYEYPLSNLQIADNGQERPVITGTVTNDSAEEAKFVEITAAFFDNENHLLGVAGTLVLELGPNESQGFTIDGNTLPIACTMAVISDYDVIAVAPKY